MEKIINIANTNLMGIAIWVYLAVLSCILLGFISKKIASIVFKRLISLSARTRMEFDDMLLKALSKPVEWALLLASLYIALDILPLPSAPLDIPKFINALTVSLSTLLLVWFGARFIDEISNWWEKKAAATESKLDDQLVPIIRRSMKVFLYIIGTVLALQNLGYSVTSLIAGLGIGGLAFALAAKDGLANLFGSIVIFLDKPFQVGDWIEMNDIEGTVEEVGLRTTRIRTFANSLITLPNAMFTTSSVNNWSRMKKRRIKMSIGVTYSTSPQKMNVLVDAIKTTIENDPKILNDFYLVNFDNFGPSSLDIFIYCFTETTNWAEFLNAKQNFMLEIMRCVKDLNLEFAFPTQTIHLDNLPQPNYALTGQRPR